MSVSQGDTKSLQDAVSEEVRVLLIRRGMKQIDLADALGWRKAFLSHRLMGRTPWDVNDLEALSKVLRVPVTAFFPPVSGSFGEESVNPYYPTVTHLTSTYTPPIRRLGLANLSKRPRPETATSSSCHMADGALGMIAA
jgi:transcriptional regulator with XRE-family HTH domain